MVLKRKSRLWVWLFVALLAGHALVVFLAPNAPMLQDYPDWVYQGVLFAKLLAHHPVAGYLPRHYPVPNSLTTVGVGLLTLVVGWEAAAKIWIAALLAIAGAAFLKLLRRLGAENEAVLPIFASSIVTGLAFWNGNINFALGLALLLVLLAHLLRPQRSEVKTGFLLCLCFFAHMLPYAAGLLAVAALAMQERKWRSVVPALPSLLLGGWYVLARDAVEIQRSSSLHLLPAMLAVLAILWWGRLPAQRTHTDRAGTALAWVWPSALPDRMMLVGTKIRVLFSWLGPLNVLTPGSPTTQVLWPSVLLFDGICGLGLVAAGVGLWVLFGVLGPLMRSADPRRFVAVTTLALGAIFLLSPLDALGVIGIDDRFLQIAVALGLALLSLNRGRLLVGLAVLATVIGVVNLTQFTAVEFEPTTVSVPYGTRVWPGGQIVAPAMRMSYYESLRQGSFNRWIFPTALFRWTAH